MFGRVAAAQSGASLPIQHDAVVPGSESDLPFQRLESIQCLLGLEAKLEGSIDGEPVDRPCPDRTLGTLQELRHEQHDLNYAAWGGESPGQSLFSFKPEEAGRPAEALKRLLPISTQAPAII